MFSGLGKIWPGLEQWLHQSGVTRDPYHGGTLNGNSCKRLLGHIDILAADCPLHVLPFVDAFRAFKKVVRACFSSDLDDNFEEIIFDFKKSYLALGISVTPKVHALFFHVPTFCRRHQIGLGIFSEQASEAVHSKFQKTWAKYKVSQLSESFGTRLLMAVNDFNSSHI